MRANGIEHRFRRWSRVAALVLATAAHACDSGPAGPGASSVAALSVETGADQTDQAGAELWEEIVVRAADEGGAPVPGVRITVDGGGDGTVAPASVRTNAQGTATFRWTLGTVGGEQTFTFRVGDVSAPVSALAVQNLPAFDGRIEAFQAQWGVPGLGVAVVRDGKLVYARGYGVAVEGTGEPVKATHRFRIASLSKPVTAAAVMQLVEAGMLDLDDPAFDYVDHLDPAPGATPDPRLEDVTVRHLLEHSGGWDREVSPDPLFQPYEAAATVGAPAPASPETIIRYMLGRSLDFDPGTRYAYSNFGYTVLGRIIEDVTGMAYGEYMTAHVLAPMGIERMAIGRTRLSERQQQEVAYHDLRGATGESVYPGEGLVPTPYGTFHQESLDAVGGWIASPVDVMRFVTSVDGQANRPDLLGPSAVDEMTARPDLAYWSASPFWYGKGWLVRPSGGDANWWHDGLLPGTTTFMVRANHGFSWVILANASATDFCCAMTAAMDQLMWEAVSAVPTWPEHDLFERFP